MTYQLLTASCLKTGAVLFLDDDEQWSETLNSVRLADDLITAAQLTAIGKEAEEDQVVVNSFLIDVTIEEGRPIPVRFREQLRILGPSVREDFNKPVYGAFPI